VERKAALLTDTKPILRITPTVASNSKDRNFVGRMNDAAQALENVIEGVWYERGMQLKLARAAVTAQMSGYAGFHTFFNDRLRPFPDIDIQNIDSSCIILDPVVSEAENASSGQYLVIDDLLPTDYLKYTFPKVASKIKPTKGFSANADDSTLYEKVKKIVGGGEESKIAIDRTIIHRFWFTDYTTQKIEGEATLTYPTGRYFIMTDDGLPLYDAPNHYIDGNWPLDILSWHIDPRSAYGFGDIELYRGPQDIFNKLLALVIENASLMTNPIWIGDIDALAPA
jgi:hypothetical protein